MRTVYQRLFNTNQRPARHGVVSLFPRICWGVSTRRTELYTKILTGFQVSSAGVEQHLTHRTTCGSTTVSGNGFGFLAEGSAGTQALGTCAPPTVSKLPPRLQHLTGPRRSSSDACSYLSAPAARPPAARYSGTLRHQSRPAAGGRVSAASPGPPCAHESRPHQICHTTDTGGGPPGPRAAARPERRAAPQTRRLQPPDPKQWVQDLMIGRGNKSLLFTAHCSLL